MKCDCGHEFEPKIEYKHRIICGDCTDAAIVARVMGGEKAQILCADPPYGMGKENEGIQNDNLYRDKLDKFQISWYRAVRNSILDNASVYIWGTAEDLWRLWYIGGLKDLEKSVIRNEIVWNKTSAQGMNSADFRMYPTASERCLFFIIGEQGYNNNADNYFIGFDPIVSYLDEQRLIARWSIKDTKRIAGHSEKSGCHWFDKSQWTMPTREVYNSWRASANGAAFLKEYDEIKREYDEIKREFYSTRAIFNNTHDAMTDVWDFGIIRGDDRPDHPTPKPIEMFERIINTSSTDGGIVIDPFSGSGTTLIACERLNRKCRAVEISPAYVAVAIQRWVDATSGTPELLPLD